MLFQFLGTWYGVYRLRADHTYQSITIKYELTPTGDVMAYYTGSWCVLSTLKSLIIFMNEQFTMLTVL